MCKAQFLPPELGVHLIWAPQANPFSSLHLSFPVPTALQSLTWGTAEMQEVTEQKCRKLQSRNAESHGAEWQNEGQIETITSDFLKMVIYSFSQCFRSAESLMLRSLNCDKGPAVANWVFALITFDVVLKAACQLLESFDYIQVLLQSKQAMDTFLFVCFSVYKWYFLRISNVNEMYLCLDLIFMKIE